MKTGRPLPESTVRTKFPGPPPWHWNCRTTLTPIMFSWKELSSRKKRKGSKKIKEIPGSTQASMDGQVADSLTYEGWLKKQNKQRQMEALGPTRYKLWKQGKLKSFTQLIDQTGRPLTVEQLKRKRA